MEIFEHPTFGFQEKKLYLNLLQFQFTWQFVKIFSLCHWCQNNIFVHKFQEINSAFNDQENLFLHSNHKGMKTDKFARLIPRLHLKTRSGGRWHSNWEEKLRKSATSPFSAEEIITTLGKWFNAM